MAQTATKTRRLDAGRFSLRLMLGMVLALLLPAQTGQLAPQTQSPQTQTQQTAPLDTAVQRAFNEAQLLFEKDSLDVAAEALTRVMPTLPPEQRASAHNNLAYRLLATLPPNGAGTQEQKAQQQAHFHLRRALELDPNNQTARYNYELLMHRMQQPPPPPPPPDEDETPPPPSRQNPIPNERFGQRMTYEAQTDEEVRALLDKLAKDPVQYFHQARKSLSQQSAAAEDLPPW